MRSKYFDKLGKIKGHEITKKSDYERRIIPLDILHIFFCRERRGRNEKYA